MKQVAIVGGGASGIFCAICIKKMNSEIGVTIYEEAERVGKKILVTGNGRCNLSNACDSKNLEMFCVNYNNPSFAQSVLSEFSPSETINFLHDLGLATDVEKDLVYPSTYQASTVTDIFLLTLEQYGVKTLCDTEIVEVIKRDNAFVLKSTDNRTFNSDYVVICGGGKSGNVKHNCCYDFVGKLGHRVTKTCPSLVPIKCSSPLLKGLNGVRTKASAKLYSGDRLVDTAVGEVLFKDYGVSGIAIFQLTSNELVKDSKLVLDLFYGRDVLPLLTNFAHNYPDLSCHNLLGGVLNKKIGINVLNSLGYLQSTPICDVDLPTVVHAVKNFTLDNLSLLPYDMSQVTRGGIDLSQVEPSTLQSKLTGNLFFAGELLDISGKCGGYNLQFAFSSGGAVAKAIANINVDKRK